MSLRFVLRPSEERNHVYYGWLTTAQTFSFSSRDHNGFGALQIVNEDRVDAHTGFDLHPHSEFEIFTYVISGELEHGDSMNNQEVIKRGDIQLTSAGTGIRHSEKCHGSKPVHFIQIWCNPLQSGLKPAYYTRHFKEIEKRDKWQLLVAPVGSPGVVLKREANGPAPVHSPVSFYATALSPGISATIVLSGQKGYLHFVQTSSLNAEGEKRGCVKLFGNDGAMLELRDGDGVYVWECAGAEIRVENAGLELAELLLFDIEAT